LTGRSSEHRPGVLDRPVNPGNSLYGVSAVHALRVQ
jgi:hypothetical protein